MHVGQRFALGRTRAGGELHRWPGPNRRCASLTHTLPSAASSLCASQSTTCRQNRLCCGSKPSIHQCQVESPANAITRPPASCTTSSGLPSGVSAKTCALGLALPADWRLPAAASCSQTCSRSAAVGQRHQVMPLAQRLARAHLQRTGNCTSVRIGVAQPLPFLARSIAPATHRPAACPRIRPARTCESRPAWSGPRPRFTTLASACNSSAREKRGVDVAQHVHVVLAALEALRQIRPDAACRIASIEPHVSRL